MKVDLNDTIAGFPMKTVRDFLKNHFGNGPSIERVEKQLAPEYFGEHAKKMLAELIKRGLIEKLKQGNPRFHNPCYDVTEEGQRFAITKWIPRISRAKGEEIVKALIERAEAINANPNLICMVSEIRLFGSMLDPKAETVGDVDVAYDLTRREHPDGLDWIKWNQQRCERFSGRKNPDFIFQICYGEAEVERLLKGRVRSLSLHPKRDLDAIAKKFRVKSRIIFSA